MTAPGREGERAQECMASCFQAMAAAKPISPPGHKPCPTTAACPAMGGAGDTECGLCMAAGLHALPHQGWLMARHSPPASPSAPRPHSPGSQQLQHSATGLQMYYRAAPIFIISETRFVRLQCRSSGCPEAQTLTLTPNHLTV